jgi:hypothetical protein
VASITAGRIYLVQHEAKYLKGPGGHTIAKHVGKTEEELRARLVRERHLISASSFTDLRAAEKAISDMLSANRSRIMSWSSTGDPRLELRQSFSRPLGKVLMRKSGKLDEARTVTVVLRNEEYNEMPYYILTAFVGV